MVFYFTCSDPRYIIYMGRDKYENEELIRYGWPEDLWFHVDKMSSAHVYLRLPPHESIDDIPVAIVEECAQLTKFNSIEGCKVNHVNVVYTMWSNLRKTGDMATGQVGFHKQKEVRSFMVEKRINEITNRLNKTKEEKHNHPAELAELRAQRDQREIDERKAEQKAAARAEALAAHDERVRVATKVETVYGMQVVDEAAMEAERFKLEQKLAQSMSKAKKQPRGAGRVGDAELLGDLFGLDITEGGGRDSDSSDEEEGTVGVSKLAAADAAGSMTAEQLAAKAELFAAVDRKEEEMNALGDAAWPPRGRRVAAAWPPRDR